ncbi:hypothetical protein [Ulvibacterium sp.]|uniref:hypothetical protein n=1 Tax=Ulvibacterium sp. TaxID=2665914 RepID=UPI003CC5DF96
MNQDVEAFNENQVPGEQEICNMLAVLINRFLPEAQNPMGLQNIYKRKGVPEHLK